MIYSKASSLAHSALSHHATSQGDPCPYKSPELPITDNKFRVSILDSQLTSLLWTCVMPDNDDELYT